MASASVAAAPNLHCVLQAPARVAVGKPVPLRFTLMNRGPVALHVLEWNTPFEGWFGAYVEVTRDGLALSYRGPMVKRGDPSADEYLTLAAGKSRGASVDLVQPFDLTQPGHYRVQPRLTLFDVVAGRAARPRSAHTPFALGCNAVEVEIVAPR